MENRNKLFRLQCFLDLNVKHRMKEKEVYLKVGSREEQRTTEALVWCVCVCVCVCV